MGGDGANELWRDGFDWIALKVISKVGMVRFGLIHIFIYINQ